MATNQGICKNCGSLIVFDERDEQCECVFCHCVFPSAEAIEIFNNPEGREFPNEKYEPNTSSVKHNVTRVYSTESLEKSIAREELRKQNSPEVVELDLDDMDKAAGGSRDWATQGCAATVEEGSWCWGNDFCFLTNVTYIHRPTSIKCPNCGAAMYHDESYVDHGMPKIRYKCPGCGAEKIEIPPHSLK